MIRMTPLALFATVLAVGCTPGTPEGECAVTPPDAWSSPDRDSNAEKALALRDQLDGLVADTMRAAEEGTVTVDDITDLSGPYEAGEPSVKDITSSAWQGIASDALAEFLAVAMAGAQDLVDEDAGTWTPGAAGGLFGSDHRGINEGGLEVRQLIDKGLYSGGAFYPHALSLTEGEITAATVDELSALWGGNAELDAAGELTDSANYSHRMGYHADIAAALTAARAYAEDEACAAERDEALVTFFRLWEESMFARFTHYVGVGAEESALAVSDDEVAHAIHELSEGVGLGLGFYGVATPASGPLSDAGRVVSDEQLEEMMALIGVDIDSLGASTTGELVMDPDTFATNFAALEALVGEALGKSADEVAGWASPTEG